MVDLKANSLSLSTSDFSEIFGANDAEKFPLSLGGLSGDAQLSTHATDELLISSIQESLELEPLVTKSAATPTKGGPNEAVAMEIGRAADGADTTKAEDSEKVSTMYCV